jgi:hypothetical protein
MEKKVWPRLVGRKTIQSCERDQQLSLEPVSRMSQASTGSKSTRARAVNMYIRFGVALGRVVQKITLKKRPVMHDNVQNEHREKLSIASTWGIAVELILSLPQSIM